VKERAERRKKSETDAEVLKSKGNKAFKLGRYQEAIDCYTEAIKLVKYFPALYTNRAQVSSTWRWERGLAQSCKRFYRTFCTWRRLASRPGHTTQR
jgi:tetratricopeptide (TPR) repeat protein